MAGWEAAAAAWAGACLGSFLNVVAYRLPRGESLVRPGSRCPRCRKPIAWRDNVPVLGWLMLAGRCRRCRGAISPRYPLVEAVMGLLAAALWWRWRAEPLWAASAALACGVLLAVALIDWDTFLIPDELSLGLLGAGWLAAPLNPYLRTGQEWWGAWGWGLAGAAAGFLMCWTTAVAGERLFKREAMGGGDLKLLAAIGAWTGVLGAFDALLIASFVGAVYGTALIARGRLKRYDPIPFGPFLSAGAVFTFFHRLPAGFPFL